MTRSPPGVDRGVVRGNKPLTPPRTPALAATPPTVPDAGPHRLLGPLLVGTVMLGVAAVLFLPAFEAGPRALPGAAASDAVRGAWGFDQVARSLPWAVWSRRIHFPTGAWVLPLPWASAVLLAPLEVLGPFRACAADLGLLLAAAGFATAWLAREATGSWGAGALAGAAVVAQPMTLHAVADGTPEHLAFWALPAGLAAFTRASRTGSRSWALAAGLLVPWLALDSPYAAIHGLVLAPVALAGLLPGRAGRPLRAAGWAAAAAVPGLVAVGLLYARFSPGAPATGLDAATALAGNSVDLHAWWILERRPDLDALGNLVPALLPSAFLAGAVLVGLAGLPRSLPWLLGGLLLVGLAMGTNAGNPTALAAWGQHLAGGPGRTAGATLGEAVRSVNAWLSQVPPFEWIRFPRRWLVPAALCLSVGGACGVRAAVRPLGQLLPAAPWTRTAGLAAGLVAAVVLAGALARALPGRDPVPVHAPPDVPFARWIAGRPGEGAVLLLPTVRPAPATAQRARVAVFASLGEDLASADCQYLQLLHHRPTACWPALLTVAPRGDLPAGAARLLRDLDDLARPALAGLDPPVSATEAEGEPARAEGRRWLAASGFRWVALDLGAYRGPWAEVAAGFLAPAAATRFDDGDGVLVLELE